MKIYNQLRKIKMKKLLSVVLTASIITTSFSSVVQVGAQTEEVFSQASQIVASEDSNLQTAAKPVESIEELVIKSKDDFITFISFSAFWESKYNVILDKDIDMQGLTLNPIKDFKGVFDGFGHTVSNISFKYFVENNYGTISGVNFKNVESKKSNICGLVKTNFGKITNSNAELSINSKDLAGGFVSENVGIIEKCDFKGKVNGGKCVGGFCAVNSGKIISCTSKSVVEASTWGKKDGIICGGFIGINNDKGEISSCDFAGNVKSDSRFALMNCGGFVGTNKGKIKSCTSKGEVKGNIDTAIWTGLIGACGFVPGWIIAAIFTRKGPTGNVGGFCGNNLGEIASCESEGTVKACAKTDKDIICGGFIGVNENGIIEDCKETGDVKGEEYVGCFAGVNKSDIVNCHATGKATAKTRTHIARAGGFVGENKKGTINKCTSTGGSDSRSKNGQAKAGGFVGVNKAIITDSSVSTKKNVKVYLSSGIGRTDNGCGGFVGKNDKGGSIKNCYATTNVETTNHKKGGGFVGEAKNNSEIYDSRCDTKLLISKNGKTKQAAFCQDNDHNKAVIENCYDFIIIKLDF